MPMTTLTVDEAIAGHAAAVLRKREIEMTLGPLDDEIAVLKLAETAAAPTPEGTAEKLQERQATRTAAEEELKTLEKAVKLAAEQIKLARAAAAQAEAAARWKAFDKAMGEAMELATAFGPKLAEAASAAAKLREKGIECQVLARAALESNPTAPAGGWGQQSITAWDDLAKLPADIAAMTKKAGLEGTPMRSDWWETTPLDRIEKAAITISMHRPAGV